MRPLIVERPLIIERPDLQSRAQRYGYLSVTFLAWFLWLYLFVPLLSFAAWAVGAGVVYEAMLQNLETAELLRLVRTYGSGVLGLAAVYVLWAFSSWLRFRGVDRRGKPARVTDDVLAASHRLGLRELAELRRSGRTVLAGDVLERMFSPGAGGAPPAGDPEQRSDAA